MIESSVNNQASVALRQAQGQDMRSLQNQREVSESAVEEQASSRPMAASGVESSDSTAAAVSTQPSDVVTRLGETTEQVPLYEAARPAGTIIRPAIEVAQNAVAAQQVPSEQQINEQVAQARQNEDQAASELREPATPARGRDPSPDDVQNLV
ncbi:hypothetical protein [Marinospirillum alkaliphilum]|uniref:Uncharacterized protein n=1 Tax=Marinospirillum alkaliphilum DSM 21637 TaxID=1122209 RepID=A0A1K1UF24_9GAMM|nr:hypothetical protein [Marinospirillum alkaliphilum]SFX10965.1 hypothetical protein SAMN02745752_00572 [Marinospirillum alkaliphilum DSM 21637]